MSLAQRSIQSATWAAFATIGALPINFIHSVLLARWLPVEYFGIYAAIYSINILSLALFEFGFTNSFIHRTEETRDEASAASSFFTLRLIFDTAWAVCLLAAAWLFFSSMHRFVLVGLVITNWVHRFTITPRTLLVRRVKHRRLAVIDLSAAVLSALIALWVAYRYRSIWALLLSPMVTTLVTVAGMYVWRPFWKPVLSWDRKIWKYFFRFGSKNLVNHVLDNALDNLDNLWTSLFLGDVMLGFYSRAYKFAIYPRMIIAAPINSVVIGTYAELKNDRKRLSHAFFQSTAFLTRSGFFLAGWIATLAPYLIELILGPRWLPMLTAFQLMLLFTMLDPIKGTLSSVLVALGMPERITRVRFTQLAVQLSGFFILGPRLKTAGVALSMDLMVLVGTMMAIYYVRPYVQVSWLKLFSAPLAALGLGMGSVLLLSRFLPADLWIWYQAAIKGFTFPLVFCVVLLLLEGKAILRSSAEILGHSSLKDGIVSAWRSFMLKD